MIDVDGILQLTRDYDVITFDVFDTLIIRDVMKPTDLFEVSYGLIGRYIRVASEIISRKKKKNHETTLDSINKICPFSCKKELEDEKRLCRANPKMFEIYKALKKQGKRMYAISDMYLPSSFIQELLSSAGYDLSVIVSCEEEASKRDGGLFMRFLNKYGFSSEDVIHIGDNIESDGEGARRAGIRSITIDRHTHSLSYIRYSIKNSELISFINHGLNELSDPIESIGYEIVGPIILAFCQWVHKQYEELEFDRLYFLARDMRFTHGIYRLIYPDDDVRYLCISRKSLKFAENNENEMCEYLKNEECFGNVAVVDTGWVGGMQIEIERYAKMINPDTDLGGLYLGSKLAYCKIQRSTRSRVFMYSSKFGQLKAQLIPPFMETLIGCNEKQVVSYSNGVPDFDRLESRDQTDQIKRGATLFIKQWVNQKNNSLINLSIPRKSFERLFYFPKKEHIKLMKNLHYEDAKDTPIVSFDKSCHYFVHPRRLISDLSDSAWKGAFFRELGLGFAVFGLVYYIFNGFRLWMFDISMIKK